MPAINPGKSVSSLTGDGGGTAEQSYINCIADTGVYSVQDLTFDTFANIGQGEFFVLVNKAGLKYGCWFDKDANGTEPTGAAYAAVDTEVPIAITTGMTAENVADAAKAAITSATAGMTFIDNTDASVKVTQSLLGPVTAALFYNNDSTAYSGGGALAVAQTVVGVASNLQNKYVLFNSGSDAAFNVWMNVGAEGVDPNGAGTNIESTITASASAAAVATALAAAIDANANFEAEADGSRVKVTNSAEGSATDLAVGTSPFTVSVQAMGSAESYTPAMSPGSLNNNPSA